MVTPESIRQVINPRLGRILQAVELSLTGEKFRLCRKIILDEFGKGLERELQELYGSTGNQGRTGTGGPILRGKDGAL